MDLIRGATATFTGGASAIQTPSSVQGTVTGTGAVTASITIEVTNDLTAGNYITLGVISLSGTTTATDGFAFVSKWLYIRARLTAISGTGATVVVTLGG